MEEFIRGNLSILFDQFTKEDKPADAFTKCLESLGISN
jgi:hypothetical protein